jgi:hypothetical protein
MWIVTDRGFFSFVVDRKDSSQLWLRARVREDLARNFPGVEIIEKPGSDYVFRAKVSKEVVAKRMAEMIMEADITGHFKDVAKSRSAKPEYGDRGTAYYAFWTAMAKLQPYAPYSKVKRSEEKPLWRGTQADRRPGEGQGSLYSGGPSGTGQGGFYSYGGAGLGQKASSFDWNTRDWGGVSSPDPVLPSVVPDFSAVDDDEWARMSAEEQEAYLDAEEAWLRAVEDGEDQGAAARAEIEAEAVVLPAPRNRPGNRRQRRKAKRKNRHNQRDIFPVGSRDAERQAQRNREGLNGQEAQNRQAYLDKQVKKNGVR